MTHSQTERTYRIEVSLEQLRAINTACELLARCGMGQVKDIAFLSDSKMLAEWGGGHKFGDWRDALDAADILWRQQGGIEGWGALGPQGLIALDLYHVVRNRIAEDTFTEDAGWSVWFDEPRQLGPHPLAKIEEVT
jgi:hypothetical protein